MSTKFTSDGDVTTDEQVPIMMKESLDPEDAQQEPSLTRVSTQGLRDAFDSNSLSRHNKDITSIITALKENFHILSKASGFEKVVHDKVQDISFEIVHVRKVGPRD